MVNSTAQLWIEQQLDWKILIERNSFRLKCAHVDALIRRGGTKRSGVVSACVLVSEVGATLRARSNKRLLLDYRHQLLRQELFGVRNEIPIMKFEAKGKIECINRLHRVCAA